MDDDAEVRTWERAVSAVAEREDVDPMELEPPLGAVIDPTAAESVLASAREHGTDACVVFDYRGYEVAMHSDGEVAVVDTRCEDDG